LFRQIDTELFQDVAGKARLTRESILMLTFGVLFTDLDLDGNIDLITANGHIEPEINAVQQDVTFAQAPQVFLNDGNGEFVEVSSQIGGSFEEPVVARGIAQADIDRDGDPDLLITVNGGSPMLLRNELPRTVRNSIGITLRGKAPNLDAIGANVILYADGHVQRRMVRTGSSYLSQSDIGTLLFGLDDATIVDSLIVRWPTTGSETRFGPLQAGQRYLVTEDDGRNPVVIARWSTDQTPGRTVDPLED
jgi:prepilin-type processing-associated H-X9-DG protein